MLLMWKPFQMEAHGLTVPIFMQKGSKRNPHSLNGQRLDHFTEASAPGFT